MRGFWILMTTQHLDKLWSTPGAMVVLDEGMLPCNSPLTVLNYVLTGLPRLGFLSGSFITSHLICTTRKNLWSLVQLSQGWTSHGTSICSCSHPSTTSQLYNAKGSLSTMPLYPPLFNLVCWWSLERLTVLWAHLCLGWLVTVVALDATHTVTYRADVACMTATIILPWTAHTIIRF